MFIRITLDPYVLETLHIKIDKSKQDKTHYFKQQFYIPIHNHFSVLHLDVYYIKSDSWFRENKKEVFYGSA